MNVSVKIFIRNNENKFLVLRRSETHSTMPFYWDIPGGHLEEGENILESIKRETVEECGFEVKDIQLLGVETGYSNTNKFWVQIAHIGKVDNPEVKISSEHDQFKWVTKEEFPELQMTDMVKKLFSLIK